MIPGLESTRIVSDDCAGFEYDVHEIGQVEDGENEGYEEDHPGNDYGNGDFAEPKNGTPGETKEKEFYVPVEVADEDLFEDAIGSGLNFSKYDKIPVKVCVMQTGWSTIHGSG